MAVKNHRIRPREASYEAFEQLDGTHPWMNIMPDGFVAYHVRELSNAKIAYFNFPLAKEMGLIATNHPEAMNAELAAQVLKTFAIQIINEYDLKKGHLKGPANIKPNKFMATRYLQLQHPSKKGHTSGDGRCIWNGQLSFQGQTWDVSSRGTGVTCLAPGSVEAGKPLQTGKETFGYGCGLAELDELIGAAILAESFHLQGISTERVLTVIDLGNGVGIGVRAGKNLFRPAHLFLYLKQGRIEELTKATDYLIQEQIKNHLVPLKMDLNKNPNSKINLVAGKKSFRKEWLQKIAMEFGKFAAVLEANYIFAWLDWDGDNVLAHAGIIDYGSIRQFGMRHDRYRYDDVERFSTNLKEQKRKAKEIVQVFCQMINAVETGKKKSLSAFKSDKSLKIFDAAFESEYTDQILLRLGLNSSQRQSLVSERRKLVKNFLSVFHEIEEEKISGKMQKVSDGVNQPAKFNIRRMIGHLPQFVLEGKITWTRSVSSAQIKAGKVAGYRYAADLPAKLFELALGKNVPKSARNFRKKDQSRFKKFLRCYCEIMFHAAIRTPSQVRVLRVQCERVNLYPRITGNALINIVEELLRHYKRNHEDLDLQGMIDHLIYSHAQWPESNVRGFFNLRPKKIPDPALLQKLADCIDQFSDDI